MNQIILGFTATWAIFISILFLKKILILEVNEGQEVIVLTFGKIFKIWNKPGAYFCPHFLPFIKTIFTSKKLQFEHYEKIHINDSKGSMLFLDLFIEFQITDSKRALFNIENWRKAFKSLIINITSSTLCKYDFHTIHTQRYQISEEIKKEILETSTLWGIDVQSILIDQIGLTQEIAEQMLHKVASKLEKLKAQVEEDGRLYAKKLEMRTEEKIAELTAHAKGQYPKAIGLAFTELLKEPKILDAYMKLHEISLIKPQRTTALCGFENSDELSMYASNLMASVTSPVASKSNEVIQN